VVVKHCISRHFIFTRLWSAQFIVLLCVLLWYYNCLLPIVNAYSHRTMILWSIHSWRMLPTCTGFWIVFKPWEDWQTSENASQHLPLKDNLDFVSTRSHVHLYVYCCMFIFCYGVSLYCAVCWSCVMRSLHQVVIHSATCMFCILSCGVISCQVFCTLFVPQYNSVYIA